MVIADHIDLYGVCMQSRAGVPTRVKLGVVGAAMFGAAALFIALLFSGSTIVVVIGVVGLLSTVTLGTMFMYGAAKDLLPDGPRDNDSV